MSVQGRIKRPVPAAASSRAAGRAGAALLVIAAAQLMVVLDATIVNVALPHIQRALGFSGSGLEWAFTVIEIRSEHALLPVHLLRDRNRTGANLIMLCAGTAIFGLFFFLTLFMQTVLGYSALKTGIAFLPLTAAIIVASGAASQLLPRLGGRPMLLAGSAGLAGGLLWMSRIGEHSSYPAGVLGPTLLAAAGLGLLFVPLNIVAMSRVPATDSGAASSLLNAGQQIGGSIGLAVLGTLAWTYNHALAAGFARAFLAASGIALLALLITIITIRIRPADLTAAT